MIVYQRSLRIVLSEIVHFRLRLKPDFKQISFLNTNIDLILSHRFLGNMALTNVQSAVKQFSKKVEQASSEQTEESEACNKERTHKKKTLAGGVIITDITVGSGALAKNGKTISVYYSGKLKSTNKTFDELTEGPPLIFRLGRGDVIDGWDVGLVGMKVGGKRIITCPPGMAYGAKGYPPVIPPNSTLVFEVELKEVE